jgi:hypothetical protein
MNAKRYRDEVTGLEGQARPAAPAKPALAPPPEAMTDCLISKLPPVWANVEVRRKMVKIK